MCKIGDIIVVDRYESHGTTLSRHSFIVLDDTNGQIYGMNYDMIGLVMSSFKDPTYKARRMALPGTFPVVPDDEVVVNGNGNGKSGFIKADQFYYFDKTKINYRVIGSLQPDIFNLLIEFINELKTPIDIITDNL